MIVHHIIDCPITLLRRSELKLLYAIGCTLIYSNIYRSICVYACSASMQSEKVPKISTAADILLLLFTMLALNFSSCYN